MGTWEDKRLLSGASVKNVNGCARLYVRMGDECMRWQVPGRCMHALDMPMAQLPCACVCMFTRARRVVASLGCIRSA